MIRPSSFDLCKFILYYVQLITINGAHKSIFMQLAIYDRRNHAHVPINAQLYIPCTVCTSDTTCGCAVTITGKE